MDSALGYLSALMSYAERAMPSIEPLSYAFLFPPTCDMTKIQHLITARTFPTIARLAPGLVYAVLLSVIRLLMTNTVFTPLACMAMKLKVEQYAKNSIIDNILRKNNHISQTFLLQICRESNFKKDYVVSYIKIIRKNKIAERKIVKFTEALWRFIFYFTFCVVGSRTLFTPSIAPWITDTKNHFINWPLHAISEAMDCYYQVQLGSYIHQLFWTEVSRSDALEMILHHLTTISLISFSYVTNFVRIGSSILLLHDLADIFLESAKIFNYASKAKGHDIAKIMCDILFGTFAITFFITRLVVYPGWILYSVAIEAPAILGEPWAGFWVFLILLLVLQCLHLFWFYTISKMIYKLMTVGIEKDERSDDEDESKVVKIDE